MKTHRYRCSFGSDVVASIAVPEEVPADISNYRMPLEWETEGRPDSVTFRAYVGWMNQVNKETADRWEITLAHIYATPEGKVEEWLYIPGKAPKRTSVLRKTPNNERSR